MGMIHQIYNVLQGNVAFNPVLALAGLVASLRPGGKGGDFVVARSPENGGDLTFSSHEELVKTFATKAIHPGDLKAAVQERLKEVIAPIRAASETPALKKLANLAFPPPPKKAKV